MVPIRLGARLDAPRAQPDAAVSSLPVAMRLMAVVGAMSASRRVRPEWAPAAARPLE